MTTDEAISLFNTLAASSDPAKVVRYLALVAGLAVPTTPAESNAVDAVQALLAGGGEGGIINLP